MRPSITTKLLFLILLSSVVAAAQSPMQAPARSAPKAAQAPISDFGPNAPYKTAPPPRMDIPAIAKAAKGTIVTIVMADNDKPIAQGTGFLVSADGVVVTNYHVIETGNFAVVKFPDGTVLPVEGILAADKVRDLAIVKIHGKTFSTVRLGDSNQVQVGEEVVAIGNPLGLELTVSDGIVSGLRSTQEGRFLQTTAPISPGSSGGPLFNMYGQVVGINTMYLEGGENLNFAIPVNEAKSLLLSKSGNLRSLPNEPAAVEIEQVQEAQSASMEQQKNCAEGAERAFRKRFPDGRWLGADESYTSHYNTARGVCFIEMSSRRFSTDPNILTWLFTKSIDDAFGNQSYGFFQAITLKGDAYPRQGPCFIYLPGQDPIVCKSEHDFDALVLKYLGISP